MKALIATVTKKYERLHVTDGMLIVGATVFSVLLGTLWFFVLINSGL